MTDEERFQFDLQGFLIVKGVLSDAELRVLNAEVDERFDEYAKPSGHWRPHLCSHSGQPFVDLIDHDGLMPYLPELIGPYFRVDLATRRDPLTAVRPPFPSELSRESGSGRSPSLPPDSVGDRTPQALRIYLHRGHQEPLRGRPRAPRRQSKNPSENRRRPAQRPQGRTTADNGAIPPHVEEFARWTTSGRIRGSRHPPVTHKQAGSKA